MSLIKGFPNKNSYDSYGVAFNPSRPLSGKRVNGDIGLELEIEGKKLPQQEDLDDFKSSKLGRRWVTHTDGSLRNGGLEYVLDAPCDETEVEELVGGLFKIFDNKSSTLNLTQRTSTHVHINVSKLRANVLTSYLVLWYIFEEALVNWCGEQRAGNLFCLRSKDSAFIPDQWAKALASGSFRFANDYKYSSLNLGAFTRFGSFEFRALRGAENPELVIKWSKFLLSLRKEAETTFDNPYIIAEKLSEQGPDGVFVDICNRHGIKEFCEEILSHPDNSESFNSMCWNGFRNVQKIIYEVRWDTILDKCREAYVPDPFDIKPIKAKSRVRIEPVIPATTARWWHCSNQQAEEYFGFPGAEGQPEGMIYRNLIDLTAPPGSSFRYDLRVHNGRWQYAKSAGDVNEDEVETEERDEPEDID